MPPKNSKTDASGDSKKPKDQKTSVDEKQVREQSSKAANAALAAQKKAKELKDAAAGAGDPDERQKLMEQALDAQIEAESFGKTAKYMRSGTFQGMAAGMGIGVAPGATLGALTGTLVGGVTSTITGGIGAGVGAAAGWIGGPMVDVSKLAGKGIRKITGDLPGWIASDEQKKTLEKMVGQVNETDMPDENELKDLGKDAGGGSVDEGWVESAKGMMPSAFGGGSKDKSGGQDKEKDGDSVQKEEGQPRKKPRKLETKSNGTAECGKSDAPKKKPRKLETKSNGASGKDTAKPASTNGHPPKLETRS
jgi:hypothetical protein